MSSDTEMINVALRKCGQKRITDVGEGAAGGVAEDILVQERETLLRAHVWNFAVARAVLAPLSATPVFEYQYAHPLPSDCVRVISVHANEAGAGALEYKIESVKKGDGAYVQALCTGVDVVYLRYVREVTDPNEMTPNFRQCLILRMARVFARSLANSSALYQQLDEELAQEMRSARSIDGIEDWPEMLPEGSWAQSRRAGAWDGTRWW